MERSTQVATESAVAQLQAATTANFIARAIRLVRHTALDFDSRSAAILRPNTKPASTCRQSDPYRQLFQNPNPREPGTGRPNPTAVLNRSWTLTFPKIYLILSAPPPY
jgi:hypothetical protein